MMRTTPLRRTTLHLSQIRFTDARTFIIKNSASNFEVRTSNFV
jgi:hypothetical protein